MNTPSDDGNGMDTPRGGRPNAWDAKSYDEGHEFVFEHGADVVALLDPVDGERVLDLGCGTGHLTTRIAGSGADTIGIDASEEMLRQARTVAPDCEFVRADARAVPFDRSFDAVFSNAVLHWIPDQDAVLGSVRDALRPGGRLVAELGGRGNVAAVVEAVRAAAADHGYDVETPWYFPSVGEYATTLEANGFEPRYARLFDRPTELDHGADGLAAWLDMFGDSLLSAVPEADRSAVVADVEDRLRNDRFRDDTWVVDYRRLRVVAIDDRA